ncbi:MAG: hypothetical protein E7Z62_01810 [Thermoplasmata archaeon]|jgi:hypothetical protein|nr:hypothetical protein [Thermoplasmata archaeon]
MQGKENRSAKARSPGSDINLIPGIYDKTKQAIDYIDNLSDHDPEVSKAISSCTNVAIYTRESQVVDPHLIQDEMVIDNVNHMYQMNEMLDNGSWENHDHQCPHAKECGNASCDTCVFAQLRVVNVERLRSVLTFKSEVRWSALIQRTATHGTRTTVT